MAQTLQDQLTRGLLRLGMVELKRTAKYRRFHSPNGSPKGHFFVGSSGALRYSQAGRATQTLVVGPKWRAKVLEAGSMIVADPAKIGF